MINIIKSIPDCKKDPLRYVFETMKLKHKRDTLWLEFGVASGRTINYISQFTQDNVYGFDSFEGLPEDWREGFPRGAFSSAGKLPIVGPNVRLVKGWFDQTLPTFTKTQNKKVSFMHIDVDLYSSTKFILNTLKDYLDNFCIVVFDELVNYPEFAGDTGELKAFYEFILETQIKYEWIGMNGRPFELFGSEAVAVILKQTE